MTESKAKEHPCTDSITDLIGDLDNDVDVDTFYLKDSRGNSVLHYAVFCLSTYETDHMGDTLLHHEVSSPGADGVASEMVEKLLDKEKTIGKKKLVDEVDNEGLTALFYAAQGNLIKTAELLIERGADIDKAPAEGGSGGDTPLIKSLWIGNYDFANMLLKKGAKVTAVGPGGWTALILACSRNQIELIEMILDSKDITPKFLNARNEPDNGHDSAVSFSLAHGLCGVLPRLLSLGADPYVDPYDQLHINNIVPRVYRQFLDNQITYSKVTEKGKKSKKVADTVITFDYKHLKTSPEEDSSFRMHEQGGFLDEKYQINQEFREIKIIEDIVNISNDHRILLQHPLPRAMIMYKWSKLQKYYYLWMATKVLFFCLLLGVVGTYGPYLHRCLDKTSKDKLNTSEDDNQIEEEAENNIDDKMGGQIYLLGIYSIFQGIMIFVEILQMSASFSWWVSEKKNYLQLIINCVSLAVICSLLSGYENCELQLHLLGVLPPIVFYELLLEFGYWHPDFAKYILLLNKVCVTFFKYGTAYIGLVVTSAVSFYLIIGQKDGNFTEDFSILLAKTVVMFAGEVELFPVSQNVYFKVFEIIFFLAFIFFLTIVLMNLLNALAIVDTNKLLEDVDTEMLHSFMETVSFWEILKSGDPEKKFKWSVLVPVLKRIPCLFNILPNISILEDDALTFRPNTEAGKARTLKMFGKTGEECIINAALVIANKKENDERIAKKEKEREEGEKSMQEWMASMETKMAMCMKNAS